MKKLSIILSLSFVFVGFAMAKPTVEQQKAATEKKEEKKADKKEVKKVPARKTQDKKTPKK